MKKAKTTKNTPEMNYPSYQENPALQHLKPSHSLAILLLNHINAQNLTLEDVMKRLEYQRIHEEKALQRLQNIINSESLGLYDQPQDVKYSRSEFLYTVFKVLNIDEKLYLNHLQKIIKSVEYRVDSVSYHFNANIVYAERLPKMMLMSLAKTFSHIPVPAYFYQLTQSDKNAWILNAVHQHYRKYKDNLPYGGRIVNYLLYSDGRLEAEFECPNLERMEY